ncbi:conserved hypothetical protein [Desulforapulum autotrophicum HRM2]|uniref:Uncharacterized protein n=1 Tax=Desulforapulum autotrophicum (strain ATCC 43914 / DSM 3382 / VKM B-1955 / HRM2) TaxID=177437 RepID=C0QC84_DESAH|nr:Druantia anti-phage system protein DruA [Desulforapulum autotrophicum]ACN17101.1 conserved hypothetical protein [Desulforapulum autotrophicum HRM2]
MSEKKDPDLIYNGNPVAPEDTKQIQEKISITPRTAPQPILNCKLKDLSEVDLEIVADNQSTQLWNEYVERYHYLGYQKPLGRSIRYFIQSEQNILGCILISGAAHSMAARDSWIGWTPGQSLKNMAWVVNNSRFLIFPWVEVRYLASHVLGKITRNVGHNWKTRWGYTPALIEAFVDPVLYEGICYQASNWECLGMTTDKGLAGISKTDRTTPKKIYVKPLTKNFRAILCTDHLDADPMDTESIDMKRS